MGLNHSRHQRFGEVTMIRRPSYASVVSTLALFICLSGSGYAATSLSHGSARTAEFQGARLSAAPLGYAHLQVQGTVKLDTALSYGITAVVPAGYVGSEKKPIVCLYGTIGPHAVATATQLAPDNATTQVLAEVDIAQPWMIQRCPQSTNGRVVAVVTIADIPKGATVTHGTREPASVKAYAPPRPAGPPFAQSGVWIVFY
jgi:hypothetical protein